MTRSSHSGARSSAEEHYLDMVGVTGSIPVAPTSLRLLRKLRLGKPHSVYRSEANEGCRAEAVWRRRALSVQAPLRNQLQEIPGMFRSAIAAPGSGMTIPSHKLD